MSCPSLVNAKTGILDQISNVASFYVTFRNQIGLNEDCIAMKVLYDNSNKKRYLKQMKVVLQLKVVDDPDAPLRVHRF